MSKTMNNFKNELSGKCRRRGTVHPCPVYPFAKGQPQGIAPTQNHIEVFEV